MSPRVAAAGLVAVMTVTLIVAASGQFLFADAADSPVVPVDAVVVLGGEHDGREDFGIELARRTGASAVLLSDPYPADDPIMRRLCGIRSAGVDVLCRKPEPSTTRGEAEMARDIGAARNWRRIAVVSWRYHLFRARYVFAQCYSRRPDSVVAVAVPRKYDFSAAVWMYVYSYQLVGLAKAWAQGDCDGDHAIPVETT